MNEYGKIEDFSNYVFYRAVSDKICQWIFKKVAAYNKKVMQRHYDRINEAAKEFYSKFGVKCYHCGNMVPGEMMLCPICSAKLYKMYDNEFQNKLRVYFGSYKDGKNYLSNKGVITKEELYDDERVHRKQLT